MIGHYALAAGAVAAVAAVAAAAAPGRIRRNRPDPVPVMGLGRLAVDSEHQGTGLGRALLRDTVLRTLQAADIAGIRALLVHAISEKAKDFYERCDFRPSPLGPMSLMITLRDAEAALTARH